MKAKILTIPQGFNNEKYGIRVGETYPVLRKNTDLGPHQNQTGYLVQGEGLPLTMYPHEIQIIN